MDSNVSETVGHSITCSKYPSDILNARFVISMASYDEASSFRKALGAGVDGL